MKIDATPILNTLDEAAAIASLLHEAHVELDPDMGPRRRSDPEKAQMARDLLRAIEVCRLAAAEFSVLYWSVKGHPDPRGMQ